MTQRFCVKIYLKRFEDKGFQLVGMKLLMAEDEVRFAAKTKRLWSPPKAASQLVFCFSLKLFQPIFEHLNPSPSTEKVLAEHYGELKEKPFFPGLLEYIKVKLLFVFDKKTIKNTHLVIITIIAFVSQALSSRWPGREKESLRRPGKTFPWKIEEKRTTKKVILEAGSWEKQEMF